MASWWAPFGISLLSLADAVPLTRLMAWSACLAALANAMLLLEPGVALAILARVVTGIALAGLYPPAMKLISTWFLTGRGLALGAMVGALTLGSAVPHLIRATGSALPWQSIVWATSLACLLAAALFGLALKEGPHAFARTTVDPRQIGRILRNRPVMYANLGYFGHMWELYAMWAWFLAYASAAIAAGGWNANASILAFAVVALGAPSCLLAGWLADRIGRCYTTVLSMAVSGSAAIAIGFTFDGPAWLFIVVALIWGFTVVADSAQFSAAVTELAPKSLVGTALAFQMGVGFAITVFAIWIIPIVAHILGGWQWAFAVLAIGPVIGCVAMLRLAFETNEPRRSALSQRR